MTEGFYPFKRIFLSLLPISITVFNVIIITPLTIYYVYFCSILLFILFLFPSFVFIDVFCIPVIFMHQFLPFLHQIMVEMSFI